MRFVKLEDRPFGDKTWKTLKDWHNMYREYCLDNGEKNCQTSRSMAKIFREKGFEEVHRNNGIWFSIGIEGIDTNVKIDDDMDREVSLEELPF